MTVEEARKIVGDILKNRKLKNMSPVEKAMLVLCQSDRACADADPDLWQQKNVRFAAKVEGQEMIDYAKKELGNIFKVDVLRERKTIRLIVQVV